MVKQIARNYNKAFEWYFKSANNEFAKGQHCLGHCYYYGIGTKVDVEKAVIWYKKALNNGVKDASIMLK
ncbi:unnamed protein product [Rhizophagus irregularis]|nr:unnamed protein product [Rhizophagus irregularis]